MAARPHQFKSSFGAYTAQQRDLQRERDRRDAREAAEAAEAAAEANVAVPEQPADATPATV